MQRYINAKMRSALGPCATSKLVFVNLFIAPFHSVDIYKLYMNTFLQPYGSGKEDSPVCDVPGHEKCRMKLLRHVSFVDCPVR